MATLEWAMSLLLNNSLVLGKVQSEIDTHGRHGSLIGDSDLSRYPYLYCIINETLRLLYPMVPLHQPHESSEESTPGTLFINVWAINWDPVILGGLVIFKR